MPDGGSLTDQRHQTFAKLVLELLRRGDPATLAHAQMFDLVSDEEATALIVALMRSLPVDVAVTAGQYAIRNLPSPDKWLADETYPGEAKFWAETWVRELGTKARNEVAKACVQSMDPRTLAAFRKWEGRK